ncbi:sugar ABC transporter substrate-binding protein [Dokdonella soli]|uniref:Sugar ABC transporter substrate-binding protein n=1 Tax=Dokdonella soli TaxID=529810 RepID=A0ABP3TK66_9GAMM
MNTCFSRILRALIHAGAYAAMSCMLGCAKPDAGITVVTFWTIGREGEVVQPLLRDFERAHPTIRVDLQQWPLTAAHEKLLTAFAGDALPDVGQLGNTWIPELATLDALEPLQAYVDASTVVHSDDYFGGIWETNVIGGRLYGVPWYVDTRLLFYRTDLLAEAGFSAPPRDWAEWKRQLAAIKANAGPDKYAILLPLNEFEPLLNLAVQAPDPLLRDHDTRGNFESAGFRRAFDFYVDMFRRDWAPPMSDTQISNVWDEFANGFYAFYITGPWNVGEFRRRLPPRLANDWATAPLPGRDGPGAAIGGGSSLVMFHHSPHKQAVWQLIEFLSQPQQQRRFHQLSGDLPPRRSAWSDPALANDPYAKAFREQLERVKPAPKVPEWERIAQEMRLATERVVRGGEPVDQALRELDARTDVILEKRRWMLARQARP